MSEQNKEPVEDELQNLPEDIEGSESEAVVDEDEDEFEDDDEVRVE